MNSDLGLSRHFFGDVPSQVKSRKSNPKGSVALQLVRVVFQDDVYKVD